MEDILVVDDSALVRQLLTHLLSSEPNFNAVCAASMQETRQILTQGKHDYLAAVLDLNLPDAPHGEVVDYVNGLGIPCIILTASFDEDRREAILKKGVVDYVLKENQYSYEYIVRLLRRLDKNRHIKTLVVDDSAATRGLMSSLLQLHNFQVLAAADGEKALQILREHPDIKLVLTDYHMPKMDGFELTNAIRRQFDSQSMAVIGISRQVSHTLSAKFIKYGANDFLGNPFSIEEFYTRVMQNVDVIEYLESIKELANRDHLSKLFNRRYFFVEGDGVYQKNLKSGKSVTLAMVDIDHFKKINDNYGHESGDLVLKQMSTILTDTLPNQLVARLGGEEFAVMLSDCDESEAKQRLERLRKRVENTVVNTHQHELKFTVSIGVYQTQPNTPLDVALREADVCLYQAKHNGRNRVVARGDAVYDSKLATEDYRGNIRAAQRAS